MAVGILRRGHCFALVDVNAVNYPAVAVDNIVLAGLGAGIAAIQLHVITSVKVICAVFKPLCAQHNLYNITAIVAQETALTIII